MNAAAAAPVPVPVPHVDSAAEELEDFILVSKPNQTSPINLEASVSLPESVAVPEGEEGEGEGEGEGKGLPAAAASSSSSPVAAIPLSVGQEILEANGSSEVGELLTLLSKGTNNIPQVEAQDKAPAVIPPVSESADQNSSHTEAASLIAEVPEKTAALIAEEAEKTSPASLLTQVSSATADFLPEVSTVSSPVELKSAAKPNLTPVSAGAERLEASSEDSSLSAPNPSSLIRQRKVSQPAAVKASVTGASSSTSTNNHKRQSVLLDDVEHHHTYTVSDFEPLPEDAARTALSNSTLPSVSTSADQHVTQSPLTMEDKWSLVLLFVLYTLQGIPMGLCGSIPLILKEKGISYEGLSLFSLVSLPFSLKLLWAPFVDSVFIKSIGRRKTWLIPVQMVTGLVMVFFAGQITIWMDSNEPANNGAPNVPVLTVFFFLLYFLMATQDIAVDGWALTMLSRENVGYASTCNSIGQSFGFFLANQGFIALSDARWCQRHLSLPAGQSFVTLPGFMQFWGWVFIVVTVVVAVAKNEKEDPDAQYDGVLETYQHVVSIFRLKPIQLTTAALLTCKVAFSPADAVSGFKLQEYGMPKADIATISPLLLVVGLTLPAILSHMFSKRPVEVFLNGIAFKIVTTVLVWAVSQSVKAAYAESDSPGWTFFVPLVVVMVLHEIAGTLIFVSGMSFFAKVSDPAIGGTYMTLLNTLANLGSKWPNSSALWLLPKMTSTVCEHVSTKAILAAPASVGVSCDKALCQSLGGSCITSVDGYTVQTAAAVIIGVLWLLAFRNPVKKLDNIPHDEWKITSLANSPKFS